MSVYLPPEIWTAILVPSEISNRRDLEVLLKMRIVCQLWNKLVFQKPCRLAPSFLERSWWAKFVVKWIYHRPPPARVVLTNYWEVKKRGGEMAKAQLQVACRFYKIPHPFFPSPHKGMWGTIQKVIKRVLQIIF